MAKIVYELPKVAIAKLKAAMAAVRACPKCPDCFAAKDCFCPCHK